MVFSDTSGKQGLIEDITFLLSGVSTNDYSLADRTRNINVRNDMVWQMIFEAYGGWKFMDDNVSNTSTGVPYADQTITSGTGLYAVPTGTLTIDGVEMLPASGSVFRPLIPLTYEEFLQKGGDQAFPSTGVPLYYLLQGDILRLLPTPNFTLASALRVFFGQGMTPFTTADTTAVPGFASIFHRMLSVGAALDYAAVRGLDTVPYLAGLWVDYERRLRSFYSKRFMALFPHRIQEGVGLVEEFT